VLERTWSHAIAFIVSIMVLYVWVLLLGQESVVVADATSQDLNSWHLKWSADRETLEVVTDPAREEAVGRCIHRRISYALRDTWGTSNIHGYVEALFTEPYCAVLSGLDVPRFSKARHLFEASKMSVNQPSIEGARLFVRPACIVGAARSSRPNWQILVIACVLVCSYGATFEAVLFIHRTLSPG